MRVTNEESLPMRSLSTVRSGGLLDPAIVCVTKTTCAAQMTSAKRVRWWCPPTSTSSSNSRPRLTVVAYGVVALGGAERERTPHYY